MASGFAEVFREELGISPEHFDLLSERLDRPWWIRPETTGDLASGWKLGGIEVFWVLLQHAQLSPEMSLLDLGCGQGRLPSALVGYLKGDYVGLDPVKNQLEWCESAYRLWPNFKFGYMDVHHPLYNPEGRTSADAYEIPLENSSIDRAVMSSVITHLPEDEGWRNISEINRVLRPGGKLAVSFFGLLPSDFAGSRISKRVGIGEGQYSYFFTGDGRFFWNCNPDGSPAGHWDGAVSDIGDPVAYDREYLLRRFAQDWSDVRFVPGRWRVGGDRPPFQDFAILTK